MTAAEAAQKALIGYALGTILGKILTKTKGAR